jgi:hypothetical protein
MDLLTMRKVSGENNSTGPKVNPSSVRRPFHISSILHSIPSGILPKQDKVLIFYS